MRLFYRFLQTTEFPNAAKFGLVDLALETAYDEHYSIFESNLFESNLFEPSLFELSLFKSLFNAISLTS